MPKITIHIDVDGITVNLGGGSSKLTTAQVKAVGDCLKHALDDDFELDLKSLHPHLRAVAEVFGIKLNDGKAGD